MGGFLSKIVIKTITKVVKNTSRFDIVIDDLIDKFKDSCPPKPELLRLVKQKNQIQSALTNLTDTINTLQTTGEVTNDLIGAVSTAVKVIKSIPVPTAIIPPSGGVGIPVNVLTILSDSLDQLGKLLDGARGSVKVIPVAAKVIQTSIQNILTKLGQLDLVINKCIEELATGLNQQEKNELINEIGNAAASSGDFSNLELNNEEEELLIRRLAPNADYKFIYKRFIFQIQYNSDNSFSFPQRRILGDRPQSVEIRPATSAEITRYNLPDTPPPTIRIEYPQRFLSNIEGGAYSYSTSVKVLINELKFRIDQGERWLRPDITPVLQTLEAALGGIGPVTPIIPPPSGSTGSGSSGGGNSNPYIPFTSPGSINNEIRFFESSPYKYNQGTDRWLFTTIQQNLQPFGITGAYNGEVRRLPIQGQGQDEFYTWSQLLYLWSEQ